MMNLFRHWKNNLHLQTKFGCIEYNSEIIDKKQTKTMAELGQGIQRLANLAYARTPGHVRETIAKEQFLDALANPEVQIKI